MMHFNQLILQLYKNIPKLFGHGSGWIIDSVINQNINISNYNLLAASSYMKLLKQLDHSKRGLIRIQNIDEYIK